MYVLPAAWGGGLANDLHAAALDQLRAHGAVRARLWVLALNGRARRFYERHGWRPDGTERVVEFPPHPIDLGYALDLERLRLAEERAGPGSRPAPLRFGVPTRAA